MAIELNHTIVNVKDKQESANFVTEILGLPKAIPFFGDYFLVVQTSNGVSLDFSGSDGEITPQHYAFLVSEKEFDEIFGRIKARGVKFWADPSARQEGKINTHDGGRGLYFKEPSGHFLEIITKPYGG